MDYQVLHDTLSLVFRLTCAHHRECEKQIAGLGIHPSQHKMLMFIARRGENAPTQAEIAQHLGISAPAASATVKKLEKGGYITRSQNSDDMRNNSVSITEKGSTVITKSKEIFKGVDQKIFKGLEKSDIDRLSTVLKTMHNNIKEADNK